MSATAALWASILLGGLAQIVLKRGLNGHATQNGARGLAWWLGLLRSRWLWAWVVFFPVSTVLWILAVSQLDISYAFPMLSASYAFVALLSRVLLKESTSWHRWVAIAVICLGVFLIARH